LTPPLCYPHSLVTLIVCEIIWL